MNITVQLLSLGLVSLNRSLEPMEGGRVRNHHILSNCLEKKPSVNPIFHVQAKKGTQRHVKSSNTTFQFYAQSQPQGIYNLLSAVIIPNVCL